MIEYNPTPWTLAFEETKPGFCDSFVIRDANHEKVCEIYLRNGAQSAAEKIIFAVNSVGDITPEQRKSIYDQITLLKAR